MRRSIPSLRGAKGHGWYHKYMEKGTPVTSPVSTGFISYFLLYFKGNEVFTVKNIPPNPFDWNAKPTPIYSHAPNSNLRPKVYLDMRIEKEDIGRLTFELAYDITPITVTNFINLLPKYTSTKFYNVIKNVAIMGGDVVSFNGQVISHSSTYLLMRKLIYSSINAQGNQSSFPGSKYFKDENFVIPHTSRGLLSMVSTGCLTSTLRLLIYLLSY